MYRVTALQAVEPDELFRNKPESVTVDVSDELDGMGFNTVTITAPTEGEVFAFVLNNWGDDAATGGWFTEHVVRRLERVDAVPQPTVYVVIDESACTIDERGEVLETVTWGTDGKPDWTDAGICDHRGGAGPEGFDALVASLKSAEANAIGLGCAIRRVAS